MMIKTKFLCGTAVDWKRRRSNLWRWWVFGRSPQFDSTRAFDLHSRPARWKRLDNVLTKLRLSFAYSRRQGYLGDVEQCTQLDGRSNPCLVCVVPTQQIRRRLPGDSKCAELVGRFGGKHM